MKLLLLLSLLLGLMPPAIAQEPPPPPPDEGSTPPPPDGGSSSPPPPPPPDEGSPPPPPDEGSAPPPPINFYSITVEGLPYSVDCPLKNKDLKIKQNKKEKFVVRFVRGKKFYKGLDFDEAVDVFEETYEDKCVE